MFGIGSTELVIILIVALVLIGPKKLPDLMKSVGKGIGELRRMSSDVKTTIEREIEKADELKRIEETKKELFGDDSDKPAVDQAAASPAPEPAAQAAPTATQAAQATPQGAAGSAATQAVGTTLVGTQTAATQAVGTTPQGTAEIAAAQAVGTTQDAAGSPAEQSAAGTTPDTAETVVTQAAGAAPQDATGAAAPGTSTQTVTATPQPSQEKTHA